MSVVIETTVGDITVDLFTEERPIACLNFLKLCRLKYYNYNLFHTIEQGFIAQTGDPTGKGDGGSSIWGLVEGPHKRFFETENLPKIYHTNPGLLSLVSAGKNLSGSQFFLTLGENLSSLDGVHCVIGEVVEGHDTLLKLNEAIVDESFRPYQDVRITHTVVLDDPFPDPRGFQVPERSPSPSAERLQNGRIAADEDIDDTEGKTMTEIQEILAEREAKARATILEIVGDLPDAECAPPENVLFVCKLNPVTTDDDLEIIFSRFGKVKGCEVIRDRKTGDSLQYAFVEFEDQKSCEAAYFKMDNVLIDDRRIHVDFSQSVAKVKWRGKGRGIEGSQGRLDFNNLRDDKKNPTTDRGKEFQERQRMTSEERRSEREKRHRAQERIRRSRSKSQLRKRSRSRSYENKNWKSDRSRDRNQSDFHKSSNSRRRNLPLTNKYDSRRIKDSEHKREKRSDSRGHRNHISQRNIRNERDDKNRSLENREKSLDSRRHERRRLSPKRNETSRKHDQSMEHYKKRPKKVSKKSKHIDTSEDSDETTSSSETSSSSSCSGSSSEKDRRRIRTSKSKKKKKRSSTKKKSRKHKK